ncbi:hypothetical protein WMY93_000014 [Mugilogobius chulae]|uniref:L1 transposable element RRM domain-containing protein n=1 Tax=Mugilogobius chulae TaxID=88201 RepID=A0AAW0PY72_9GOBI
MSRQIPRGRAGTKRDRATLNKPSYARALSEAGHDYTQSPDSWDEAGSVEIEFPPLPATPTKSLAEKRRAGEMVVSAEQFHKVFVELDSIKTLINTRSDALDARITGIETKMEGVCNDVKTVTTKVEQLEKKVEQVEQPVRAAQKRIDEMETYTRKWNLLLNGVTESDQEDIRGKVIDICQQVLPDMRDCLADKVDTVHRLGRRRRPAEGTQPRTIIVQFTTRVCRDAVWKAAKTAPFLKQQGLRFKEDFSKGDKERREKLWPQIQRARNAGKKAFYVGARAFIEGEGEIMTLD